MPRGSSKDDSEFKQKLGNVEAHISASEREEAMEDGCAGRAVRVMSIILPN